MRVRRATLDDLPYIADLLCQETGSRSVETIERDLTSNNYLYYCLVNDQGTICSYISFLLTGASADIILIITDKNKRGMGYGTQLLDLALNEVKAQGIKEVLLEVRDDNSVAKHLYAKFGFVPISIRKNYYGTIDGIVMKLLLN